jgi:hypothetical protein
VVGLLVGVCLILVVAARGNGTEEGRYQLVFGTIRRPDFAADICVRIDTQTGKTHLFLVDAAKHPMPGVVGWSEIPETGGKLDTDPLGIR